MNDFNVRLYVLQKQSTQLSISPWDSGKLWEWSHTEKWRSHTNLHMGTPLTVCINTGSVWKRFSLNGNGPRDIKLVMVFVVYRIFGGACMDHRGYSSEHYKNKETQTWQKNVESGWYASTMSTLNSPATYLLHLQLKELSLHSHLHGIPAVNIKAPDTTCDKKQPHLLHLLTGGKKVLLPPPISMCQLKALHKFLHPLWSKAQSLPFNHTSSLDQDLKGFQHLTWWLHSEGKSYLALITLWWEQIGKRRQIICVTLKKEVN